MMEAAASVSHGMRKDEFNECIIIFCMVSFVITFSLRKPILLVAQENMSSALSFYYY